MKFSARVQNNPNGHQVTLKVGDKEQSLAIAPGPGGAFEAEGKPGTDIVYRAKVDANASEAEIRELLQHTDTVAEIQNTLRVGTPVKFSKSRNDQKGSENRGAGAEGPAPLFSGILSTSVIY